MELERAISLGLDLGAEFIDIRRQEVSTTSISAVNGTIRSLSTGHMEGYGVRSFIKGAWGFSVAHSTSKEALERAVRDSTKLAKLSASLKGERFEMQAKSHTGSAKTEMKEKPSEISAQEKIGLVLSFDKSARVDERVRNINVSYADASLEVEVANSFGTSVEQETTRVGASVYAFAAEKGAIERAYESIRGSTGFEIIRSDKAAQMGDKAAKRALSLLGARSAPAGLYPAILDQILAGVFIHEAFGHATEADAVLAKMSVLEGRIGEKVGADFIDVVDDPTIPELYGSYSYDDEGTPAGKKHLIRRGELSSFMQDLETASRMGEESTGNGRAMGYSSPPIVRMSNTFIGNGDWEFDEMLEEIDEGVYAKGSLYGYTDPAKGQFMFKAEGGWMIRNGELKERLREVAIAGMTLEVLHSIDAVGNDLERHSGHCGKGGQVAPTTTGSPHVRVKKIVFGGLR